MLNVLNVVMNENGSSSSYIIDSLDICHARFSHMNFSFIRRMKQYSLLSDFSNFELRSVIYIFAGVRFRSSINGCTTCSSIELKPRNLLIEQ